MALTAAETGHLVFGTLHTNNAPQAVTRIVDVFPAAQQEQIKIQLADTILAIISQILVPTVDKSNRVCAAEVMIGTPAIKNLIREGKIHQMYSTIQTSKKEGMQTLDQSLEALLLQRKINLQEAGKRAIDKNIFKKYEQPSVGQVYIQR
ncbi:MAG: ATPase, T2SS/T4P/T4SS family [bacterium]